MAVKIVTLHPSADIHLVLQPAARATLQLDALAHDDAVSDPSSVLNECTFTIADTAIATVSAAGLLTARAEGRTFLRVERTPSSGAATSVVARIWVHPRIADWWMGNNRASVHAGAADLLLSAYAVFDGGDVGDITDHGYVTFTALGGNATVTAAGRVTGVNVGDVTIRGTLDTTTRDVAVTVVPTLSTPRPIVEPVRVSGPMAQRRNVLFLAEGFTDRPKFTALVQKVVDRLVTSRLHEPFRILRDDMNYWLAFTPSRENGVTIGPLLSTDNRMFMFDVGPVTPGNLSFHQFVSLVGLPDNALGSATRADADAALQSRFPTYQPARLDTDVFDHWQLWAGNGLLQTRDSHLGLMYGARLGDREFTEAPKQADNSWYFSPESPHTLQPDPRRSPPNLARWNDGYFQLLGSLRTKKGASDPNHAIGPRWTRDADDQGLVVFLCNDECYGASGKQTIFTAVAIDMKTSFGNVSLPGSGLVVDHEPNTGGALLESLVGTASHELAHQFFLGDEYEGGPERTTIPASEIGAVERNDNLTTRAVAFTGTPPVLDPNRIKWNLLTRVARASRLAGPAIDGSGDNVDVPLGPGEGTRWKAGDLAFLRTRNINVAVPHTVFPAYRRHEPKERRGQVVAVNGDVVTVSGGKLAAGEAYPAGSTLYVPRLNKAGTAVLNLMLPGVQTFIAGPPARPVFDKAGQCGGAVLVLILPPSIPNTNLTADDRPRVIGLYEGGGRWNCGVFRPAPVCKMRDHLWPRPVAAPSQTQRRHFRLCFVCRYTIVNEVNPRRHPDLDRLYPGSEP